MKESTRVARFALIGTLNAIITAAVVWLMMGWWHAGYLLSNVVAYVVAQTHNFIWSKYWIFPTDKKGSTWRQVLLFCIVFGLAYAAQFVFLVVAVEVCGCNEYVAQFLGLVIYGTVNFLLNRRVTFGVDCTGQG